MFDLASFGSGPARICGIGLVMGSLALGGIARAQAPWPVYTDRLNNGFQNWGWGTLVYTNSSPVHSGTMSIAATFGAPWNGLQLWHSDLDSHQFASLSFWLNGGTNGGQKLQVYGLLHLNTTNNFGSGKSFSLGTLQTNIWQQFTIPLSSIGVANTNNFTGFVIQDRTGTAQPIFFVDDIQLNATPAPALNHLSVNAGQPIRSVDARWFAVNTAIWDGNFDTPETIAAAQEMGTRLMRFPGGSISDEYHWATNKTALTNTWTWTTSFAKFVHVATNAGAQAIITVNYGTGSSNEAAAWVAYANAWPTNTQPLGTDRWGVDWQSAGYWAALRSASKLGTDDGRNFLRLSRPAPFGFKYWEIGNENHGTWETDSNTNAPYFAHDPWSYAMRARDYWTLMKAVDPTVEIGVVLTPGEDSSSNGYTNHPALNPRTGQWHNGWTPVVLSTLASLGVTPDFGIHHVYPEYTDKNNPAGSSDNDHTLLQTATNWTKDATDLRQRITDYAGANGTNMELLCTENNSDAGAQGRQSTSLVNGLYYADSFCQLALTEINAFVWWDLRNSTDPNGWFDDTLYGWRTYGDLGMINGLNTRHPTFYAAKLMRSFAAPGETILGATSDYYLLSAYGARHTNGALSLLVLNKDTTTAFNGQVALSNFSPAPVASIVSYGIPQDEAARTNGPLAAQDISSSTFSNAAASFTYSFPALSLTLFTFAPAAPRLMLLPSSPPGGPLVLQLQGQPGARYFIQNATGFSGWTTVSTNTLAGGVLYITNPPAAGPVRTFWRAAWFP